MTNNYSLLKQENSSEKFYLARINPIRSLLNSLTLVSGFKYTATLPFQSLVQVKINNTTCTEVITPTNFGEYSYNQDTGEFIIVLGALLGFYQAVGNITVSYYLYFTNYKTRYANETPDDSLTPIRQYEARITNQPALSITQEDIIDRVFSIGTTSLELENLDNFFGQYLTADDSFYRREIKIWRCLDSVENVAKLYDGICADISIGRKVGIAIDNKVALLNDTFYSGDSAANSTFKTSSFPMLNPNSEGKPIFKIYSECSKTTMRALGTPVIMSDLANLNVDYFIEEGYWLTNTSFVDAQSGVTNRVWKACFKSATSSNLSETIAGTSVVLLNNLYRITVANKFRYRPGDNVVIDGQNHISVYYIDFDSVDNYVYINTSYIGGGYAISDGQTITRNAIPSITIIEADYYYGLVINRDYSVSIVDDLYQITFADNFEANFINGGLHNAFLNPDAKILYRVYNHDDLNHGTVLKSILEKAGITCEAASFITANATLIKTNFSIPYFGEETFNDYTRVVQDLLSTSFGFITIDGNFEARYKLIDALSPTLTITDNEIIDDSLTLDVKYTDVITTLVIENVHGEFIYALENFSLTSSALDTTREETLISDQARMLHGSHHQKTINHIGFSMENSSSRIANVVKNRRETIEFSTKGINFESLLGDDITVESSRLLGGVTSKVYKILSITISAEKTIIRAVDMLGI